MESINKFLCDCLPALGSNTATLSAVQKVLLDTGVETFEDLQYLDPVKDFVGILKPIQNRKLQQQINVAFKSISELPEIKLIPSTSSVEVSQTVPSTSSVEVSPTTSADIGAGLSTDITQGSDLENLPLSSFPPHVQQKMKKNIRPTPSERREVVRILAADALDKVPTIRKKDLTIVARKLIELYPNSFKDELLETTVGTGYAGLLGQLIARVENVKRIPSMAVKRAISSGASGIAPKRKPCDSYGCINFQPECFPNDETEQSQSEKKNWLISEFLKDVRDLELVDKYMRDTYVSQRICINSKSPMSLVLREWPFLKERKHLLQHANTLLGFDISARLEEAISTKVPQLKNYFSSVDCLKAFKHYKFLEPGTSFLHMLCIYFDESFDHIFRIFEENTCLNEAVQEGPATPFIACFGDPHELDTICTVVVEKECLDNMITFMEAIKIWFSSFYVFNMQYPMECPATLEFIQRAFLGINPNDKGSKCVKRVGKRTLIHVKVLKLTNKLKDFTSPWNLE